MTNIIGWIALATIIIAFSTFYCCVKCGADYDKDSEKLARPDLIQCDKRKQITNKIE